jgi:hypothetical protein
MTQKTTTGVQISRLSRSEGQLLLSPYSSFN